MGKSVISAALGLVMFLSGATARADLYQAMAAVRQQDYERAARLFRELAEIGEPDAQENLAALYMNGAGVPRNETLAYGWAVLALEGEGAHHTAMDIVRQLDRRLDESARAAVRELSENFGREALQRRLFPVMRGGAVREAGCRVSRWADSDRFVPWDLSEPQGAVAVEVTVMPDGTARKPRVLYSFPPRNFDEVARAVALHSVYVPKTVNGEPVPCSYSFIYTVQNRFNPIDVAHSVQREMTNLKAKAEAGDPNAQLSYGLVLNTHADLNESNILAMPWFLRSAQAGVPAAQYLVGVLTLAGNEVEVDESKARLWLEMAAKAGNAPAMVALAISLLRTGNEPGLREQGFEWMRQAAEAGNREGRYFFSSLLLGWPESSRRNPELARTHIEMVGGGFDFDPVTDEIRAAARAASGDFKGAVKFQRRAIKRASELRWDQAPLKFRLEAYQERRMPTGELIEF